MSLFGTGRREGVFAVLVLFVVTLLAYVPAWMIGGQRLPVDGEALARNQGLHAMAAASTMSLEAAVNQLELLPATSAAGEQLRDGHVPLWNQNARFGEPFPVSGVSLWYPGFWLLLLPDGASLLDLVMALHACLACWFMYRFLRAMGLSRFVAFLGGGGYGLGWFLTAQMDRLPQAAAAALLPLAMEMTWRVLVTRHRDPYGPLLALGVALMFLTGGTHTAVLGLLLCLFLFATSLPLLERSEVGHALRTASVAGVLAALMTAPLWLGALQHGHAVESANPDMRHLQLAGLFNAMAPNALGGLDGRTPEALQALNPGADPVELVLFPGVLFLYLLVLGLFRPKRTWHGLFWVMVGAVGFMLGLDGPVADFAQKTFGVAPLPGTALVLSHIAVVVLSCVSLENFFEAPTRRTFGLAATASIWGLVILGIVILFFLLPGQGTRLLRTLSPEATTGELLASVRHLRWALLPTVLFLAGFSVLFFMWRKLGILRFKTVLAVVTFLSLMLPIWMQPVRRAQEAMPVPTASQLPADSGRVVLAARQPLPPGSWLAARGYDVLNTQGSAILGGTADYLRQVDPSMVSTRARIRVLPLLAPQLLEHPLLTFASVSAGIAASPLLLEMFTPLSATPLAASAAAPHAVQRRGQAPRFRLLFQAVHAENDAQAQQKILELADSGALLRESVVVQGATESFTCRRPGSAARLEVLRDEPGVQQFRVVMGQGRGYLVVSDAWAPGWRATVDGTRAPILRANLAFRAVPLPEGEHEVRLVYRPWSWTAGRMLFAAGALLALIWGLLAAFRVIRPRTYGQTD